MLNKDIDFHELEYAIKPLKINDVNKSMCNAHCAWPKAINYPVKMSLQFS